jgi:hypothetical protein
MRLLDRVMRTTPTSPTHEEKPWPLPELVDVHARTDRLSEDLGKLDAAIALAEMRLRARGLRIKHRNEHT